MRQTLLRACISISFVAASVRADVYTDGTLTADLTRTGDDYTGTLTLAGQTYPATAHAAGDTMTGTFRAGASAFDFTAATAGGGLTLVTGGKTYTLARRGPSNPLDNAAAPTRADNTPLPTGYAVVMRTDAGLAVAATKPAAATVQETLAAALPDVARLLDGRAVVGSAVEDRQTRGAGLANFTGTKARRPVRGVISCQADQGQCRVKIVYADAAAPPAEWQKLSGETTAVTAAADKIALREYRMPDGTGSVGLPAGWTVKATSMLDPMTFDGPDGAQLIINSSVIVMTPNCTLMQIYRQSVQMSQRVGMRPPPPPEGLFADYAAPADAIKLLGPQINALCRKAGLPTVDDDKLISVLPAQSQIPNGRAQLIEDTATWTKPDGTRTLMHGQGRYESAPLDRDAWMMTLTSMVARHDQWATMQPTMLAILNSGKPDQQQINRVSQQRNQQMQEQIVRTGEENRARLKAQFDAGQAAHAETMASYDRHNHNWAVNQNLKARSNDNFVEYLGGTRDVLDTTTGVRHAYDLSDANAVASHLNEVTHDTDRFKAIPLRDDRDPLLK